jgi:hypothetical protein
MNRRGFLGTLVGGVAAAAAVRTFPFKVFSFPTEIKIGPPIIQQVRFVRAFDVLQNRMISRWDVCAGFGELDSLPRGIEVAAQGQSVQHVLDALRLSNGHAAEEYARNELIRRRNEKIPGLLVNQKGAL